KEDPASDELEVLLVLAGALIDAKDEGSFADFNVSADDLAHEYRALKQSTADGVLKSTLFPLVFRQRWAGLLQGAAQKEDPLRRPALEPSIRKVVHALHAMAIGYRRASDYDTAQPAHDAWLAYSIGDSVLRSARR